MEMEIVSVFDLKAQVFGRPFFVRSVSEAARSFGDEVNRAADDNALYKHPADFVLYHIGTFADDTGALSPRSPVEVVVTGSAVFLGSTE